MEGSGGNETWKREQTRARKSSSRIRPPRSQLTLIFWVLIITSQTVPNEQRRMSKYCSAEATTLGGNWPPANALSKAFSRGPSNPLVRAIMMMTLTIAPRISATSDERFTGKLLAILLGRAKRIVRTHHPVAQEFIRRFDCFARQNETALPAVLLHEAEAELIVLEQVRAEFRHRHALSLRSFHQQLESSLIEADLEAVLAIELIRKRPRILDHGHFLLFAAFGH